MNEIQLTHETAVNIERLDETLAEALGAAYGGVSVEPKRVRVLVHGRVSSAQRQTAAAILAAHHPATVSDRQQARLERAARLRQLREADSTLSEAELAALSPVLRKLAYKLARLEAELEALRGR